MTLPMVRVKISGRILDWLDATPIGRVAAKRNPSDKLVADHLRDVESEWGLATLILKAKAVILRSDGSMWPHLTRTEIVELREYTEQLAVVSAEGAAPGMDDLANLNAARAQIRRCDDALEQIRRKTN